MGILSLHILAQAARLDVQYQHTVGIGTHPQLIATETEGMSILAGQHILMRVIHKPMLFRIIAHQSTVIAGNPDAPVLILTEPGDDISPQTRLNGMSFETLSYG